MVTDKCIEIYKKNNRIKMINKDVLKDFLNSHYQTGFTTKSRKSDMEISLYGLLTPESIPVFTNDLKNFGLTRADISEVFGISSYMAAKITSNGTINKIGEYRVDSNICYHIYSIPDIISAAESIKPRKAKPECSPLEATDSNLAEALYIINKSAKVSRDSKVASYYKGDYTKCRSSKTRSLNLYRLKDKATKKLVSEGRASFIGYAIQTLSHKKKTFLETYDLDGYIFHIPYNGDTSGLQVKGHIAGTISSERVKPVSMNFQQALKLLKDYTETEKLSDLKYIEFDRTPSKTLEEFLREEEEEEPNFERWNAYYE